jgi:hypothetical protein
MRRLVLGHNLYCESNATIDTHGTVHFDKSNDSGKSNDFRSLSSRRGTVAVWGMVCLILASAISAVLVKLTLTGPRIVLQAHRAQQCEWLIESGWSLAKSRLSQQAEYSGETWDVPAEELGGIHAGQVVIKVSAPKTAPKASAEISSETARNIEIQARFPIDSTQQVKLSARRAWKPSK